MNSIIEKKCRVVMLPTNEKATLKSNLAINENNLLFEPSKLKGTWFFLNKYQHLYILSNDEIKEGDWYIDESLKLDSGFVNIKQLKVKWGSEPKDCKKIIATTDTSLDLPQPSPQFITKFIEEYNKGNVISDVSVLYEEYHGINTTLTEISSYNSNPKDYGKDYKLKVDKNNNITIKRLKDNWNREEVIRLCNKAWLKQPNTENMLEEFNNWISNNL